MNQPERVTSLVLMESALGTLPGAERFFKSGPPWWFGFHSIPGFAEVVLAGHEADYVEFFLRQGMANGRQIPVSINDALIDAYRAPGALQCAFEYYRAMPQSAVQIADAVARTRLSVPTLAVGGQVVGDATARQLAPITDHLDSALLSGSGHIIPLDQPDELLALMGPFLR